MGAQPRARAHVRDKGSCLTVLTLLGVLVFVIGLFASIMLRKAE